MFHLFRYQIVLVWNEILPYTQKKKEKLHILFVFETRNNKRDSRIVLNLSKNQKLRRLIWKNYFVCHYSLNKPEMGKKEILDVDKGPKKIKYYHSRPFRNYFICNEYS